MRLSAHAATLIILVAALVGCGARTDSPSCGASAQALRVDQVPQAAQQVALQFVDALYTYNTKQLQELSEPDLQPSIAKEAFNGPNTAPVSIVENPKITAALTCGRDIQTTVTLRAQQNRDQVTHTLWLTLRAHGDTWRIAKFSADYASDR